MSHDHKISDRNEMRRIADFYSSEGNSKQTVEILSSEEGSRHLGLDETFLHQNMRRRSSQSYLKEVEGSVHGMEAVGGDGSANNGMIYAACVTSFKTSHYLDRLIFCY